MAASRGPFTREAADLSDRLLFADRRHPASTTSRKRRRQEERIDGRRTCERLVRVGRSSVCSGLGVFAAADLPAGSYATAYPFVPSQLRRTRHGFRGLDYSYDLADPGSAATLDGHPAVLEAHRCARRTAAETTDGGGDGASRCDCWPFGAANLVNDALHFGGSSRPDGNNCEFREEEALRTATGASAVGSRDDGNGGGGRLYLVTTRDVRAGEELLVPYGLEYWVSRWSCCSSSGGGLPPELPAEARSWLACHASARRAIRRLSGDARAQLGDFDGFAGSEPQEEEGEATTTFVYTVEFSGPLSPAGCGCAGGADGGVFRRRVELVGMNKWAAAAAAEPHETQPPLMRLTCAQCRGDITRRIKASGDVPDCR
jgi:hypothetical protein